MGSKKTEHRHKTRKGRPAEGAPGLKHDVSAGGSAEIKLEIVLKCRTSGSVETVDSAIASLAVPGVEISCINTGIGVISKSDIFMAETGSRLIIGFEVGCMPHLEQLIAEHNVEIRLYEVIYRLLEDLEATARSLVPHAASEEIVGSARVIALFKSSRKGIILGCEVLSGKLAAGHSFRVLDPMGPIYTGTIESLHIEKDAVREARKGQQVGLKITDFNKARIGDLIESFQVKAQQYGKPWQPQGKIFHP
jgi:translation initiation factor IF-2